LRDQVVENSTTPAPSQSTIGRSGMIGGPSKNAGLAPR
jgi:hypothetical protein